MKHSVQRAVCLGAGLLAAGLFLESVTPAKGDDFLVSSAEFLPLSEGDSGFPMPEWSENTGATSQSFAFFDDSLSGPADAFQNPFGTPAYSINVTDGQAAWLDPDAEGATVRENNGGVWEVRDGDQMAFSVPIQSAGNGGLSLDFQVNLAAFQGEGFFNGFYSLPGFSVNGYAIDGLQSDQGPLDESVSNGDWVYLSWRGTVHDVTDGELTFVVSNFEPETLALIDSVEAYVIPEPGTYVLLFGIAAAAAVWVRRKVSR